MRGTLLIQILLLATAIIISTFTIYFYFYKNENLNKISKFNKMGNFKENNFLEVTKKDKTKDSANILNNVTYENFDNEGNRYKIKAKFAYINLVDENSARKSKIIDMTDVDSTIYLKELGFLTITSDKAIFNNKNFETNFFGNVELKYLDHQLFGSKLNLLFEQNLITMENQVVYKNLDTELAADRIVIDLITKNSKIFMKDDARKLRIFNKK
tara:strand:+ start:961 stop:1599 length:639 start_codon:yes stop_codon:yes gene_type:complete